MEVAFAGRSNVGNPALINALTGRNALGDLAHAWPYPGIDLLRRPDMPASGWSTCPVTLRIPREGKVASWTALIHKFCRAAAIWRGLCADRRPAWPQGGRSRRAEDARPIGRELSGRPHKADQVKHRARTTRCRHRGACKTSGRFPEVLVTSSAHRRRHAGIGAPPWCLLGERS